MSHSNNSSLLASPRWAAQPSADSDGKPVALAPDVSCSGLLAAITARDGGSNTDIQVCVASKRYNQLFSLLCIA